MSELKELPLASIEVGTDRARDLDPDWAEGLAGSMREQGLMQPIRVRPQGDGYRLVFGRHRLEAASILGWETISCVVADADDDTARLEEIMENLARHELIALDRCRHLCELKRVWEASRARPLIDVLGREGGKSFPTLEDDREVFGFARVVADHIGLSKRYINLSVKIWTGLAPQTRQRLRGTDLARKMTELKALSEIATPRKQGEVLDAIFDESLPDVGNVAQALAHLAGGVATDGAEKQFQAVRTAFSKLPDATFDMVVSAEVDRVIASLKRLGRL